jgi:hypothetical protein
MADLVLSNDMRVGAIGRTRSGKTFLMERLLADQPRVLVIDDKERVNWPGYHLTVNPSAALLEPKTILRPGSPLPNAFWEDALYAMHEAGGGIIYIDELAEETTPHNIPAGMQSIFRLGGELGVGLWFSCQSATEVHNSALRGCDILVLFLNIGSSDRDKIIKITGDIGEVTAFLELYQFVVFESANQSYDPNAIPAYKYEARPAEVAAA